MLLCIYGQALLYTVDVYPGSTRPHCGAVTAPHPVYPILSQQQGTKGAMKWEGSSYQLLVLA